VTTQLLTHIVYLVSIWLILNRPEAIGKRLRILIFGCALLFRITAWPVYPFLSEDVYRYRWEGKLQAHGGNPYAVRPNDPEWVHLRDATFPNVVGRDFKATYGPLTESVEAIVYEVISRFTSDPFVQAFWFKLPAAIFDFATIAALVLLLRARGYPIEAVAVYAWSPTPIIEFWMNGHNDSLAIFLVVCALLAAARSRWVPSFACLSLAAAAKIWPLLLFPTFIGRSGWRPARPYQWLVLFPIAVVLAAPYWTVVTENVQFATGFLGGWRNNDSLYGLILWLIGDAYTTKYTIMALIAGVAMLAALPHWPREKACLVVIGSILLFSSNCHPWYPTWLIPLLTFYPYAPLLLWIALMPFAYAVLIPYYATGLWEG
jgi:hypothetical protein